MNKIQLLSVTLIAFLFAGGCTNSKQGWGATGGAVLGAAAGFLTGDSKEEKLRNAFVGGAAGAMAGGMIGSYLDEQDKKKIDEALTSTPDGQTATWTNPNTGNQIQVTPLVTSLAANGQRCRTYKTSVLTSDGKRKMEEANSCS